ncbi:hypothetical protein M422DRAFT_269116 [Sphaerobolus stellatus SS14]|uniref:Uncharacterized protein n=1 Tax=Sphaerobolus stellatus (strain SS14) TaxID=990650 RepID=A0A0C9TIR7_SPHS4|nr:hypothetical protein M422DRAFT_269116 [Sphaerobolus stellatus SS14]
MSTCCTRKWTEELSAPARPEVLAPEHPDELHVQAYGNQGELMIPSPNSVDTQQSPEVLALEHLEEPYAQAYENAEIVVSEDMEATEQVNTVFTRIRASMNRMSPRMKEILLVPSKKASGKMHEPGNNWAHDKAAAKAATECSIDQIVMMMSAPGSGTDEHVRTTRSGIPGDGYLQSQPNQNIP